MKRIYRQLKYLYQLVINFFYDLLRYFRHSSFYGRKYTKNQLLARIIAHYHVIEKGLSFPHVKSEFGRPIVKSLNRLINEYIKEGYDTNNVSFITSVNALKRYNKFHTKNGLSLNWIDLSNLNSITNVKSQNILNLCPEDVVKHAKADFKSLALNRYSIRTFSKKKEVDKGLLEEAVKIALKTPSVCNRQAWNVYCLSKGEMMKKILKIHQGNRGFSDLINKLLIITCDLSCFDGAKERYQCYIDGGLFSMSLMYSLEYLELAVCPLNWSAEKHKDLRLRKVFDFPISETVIMFLAVGHYAESFKVPASNRKKIEETLTFVDG